jgi:hypothetical protein
MGLTKKLSGGIDFETHTNTHLFFWLQRVPKKLQQ